MAFGEVAQGTQHSLTVEYSLNHTRDPDLFTATAQEVCRIIPYLALLITWVLSLGVRVCGWGPGPLGLGLRRVWRAMVQASGVYTSLVAG